MFNLIKLTFTYKCLLIINFFHLFTGKVSLNSFLGLVDLLRFHPDPDALVVSALLTDAPCLLGDLALLPPPLAAPATLSHHTSPEIAQTCSSF